MVGSNRLSSVVTCPSPTEGWTSLSEIPLAKVNDKTPQILAKGLPQGSLCQKVDSSSGTVSFFVRQDAIPFANLLLTPPKMSLLSPPPTSDEDVDLAMALVSSRRHPEPGESQQLSAFEKSPPPTVDPDVAGIEWMVVDANLTPQLVTLIRHEMKDSDNVLFRQAGRGVSYYATTDTEKLSRMVSVLQEIKRDLTEIGQLDVAGDVNQVAVQLTYVQSHLQATQPFWNKPFRELWPMAVVGAIGAVGIGWGFHQGGIIAARGNQLVANVVEWIRNNRRPPSAGAGGVGVSDGTKPGVTSTGHDFSMVDDRVDTGEIADFQNDPTRAYDPLQHVHINGAAIAAVVVAGGVMLLVPEIVPFLAITSPESVSLATGVGVFAASH